MPSKRSPSQRRRLSLFVISCTLACPSDPERAGQRRGRNTSANAYGPGMRLSRWARNFPPKKAEGRKYMRVRCDAAAGGGGKVRRGPGSFNIGGHERGGVLIKGRDQTRGPTCWITELVDLRGIFSIWKVRSSRRPRLAHLLSLNRVRRPLSVAETTTDTVTRGNARRGNCFSGGRIISRSHIISVDFLAFFRGLSRG